MTESLRSLAGATMALWLGAVLMTGAAAAIAFPAMRELSPALIEFAGHEQDHWSIVAGHTMMPVFRVLDFATLALAAVALVLSAITLTTRSGKFGRSIWIAALLGAALLGGHHALVRSPAMATTVHAYWDAARAGNTDEAAQHKEVFDAAHPVASRVLKAESALLALAIAGWAFSPRREYLAGKESA